ncbi:MAG TPA: hypothetical protein VHJ58_22560 [Vicinamibacterales bacterium]|jgi:hypothetical protein|nr:hypothetical protein [Vicinamibacterales bacterium]
MQIAVDRPEVGISHPGVLPPRHWRSAGIGTAPAKEYARLSAEIDAIQRAATTGNCAD